MKRVYFLISFLVILLASTQLLANNVIIKGVVKYSNGHPAPGRLVTISIDTLALNNLCRQTHFKYTNANGFYADTLSCSSAISRVRVTTADCDGKVLAKYETVPSTGVVELNFVLCTPPPSTNCTSNFTFSIDHNSQQVKFNSETSRGSTSADVIVKRKWRFGDGSVLEGNVVDPVHTYSKKGAYKTCLTIVTAEGCEKTECRNVVFDSVPVLSACQPAFNVSFSSSNKKVVKFNSNISATNVGDTIIRRIWKFGDGEVLEGNSIDPQHTYAKDGNYNVCLKIKTTSGCEREVCKLIEVRSEATVRCEAKFTASPLPVSTTIAANTFKFNSNSSEIPHGDSIRERIWKFGDGSALGGNVVEPMHTYAPGSYSACLVIRTKNGCSDTTCYTINATVQNQPVACKAGFTFNVAATKVRFNAGASTIGDSIISRTWEFGDGTSMTGNIKEPTHEYAQPALYNVCLTVKTKSGCVSKECRQVVTTRTATECIPHFTYERIAPKKFRFNSSTSFVPVADTIVERRWIFGDGSAILTGNVVNPTKEFARSGIYSVCLKIRTAKGCLNEYCIPVRIEDSVSSATTAPLKIVSLYPTPVTTQMTTVIASLNNNIEAELSIHDIYGVKKWSTKKVLLKGENVTAVPTSALLAGPYFFRVTSMYGVQSRQFYKL